MLNIATIAPSDLHPIMQFCRSQRMSLLILGEPGCGKSEMVGQFAGTYCDGNLIDLRLTTIQATDVRGMSIPDFDRGETRFLPPDFLPDRAGPRQNGVLFFDEIDRAGPAEQAAAMSILLERRSADRHLPDGWLIVAAGNGVEFSDNTYEFDPGIADRLVCIRMIAQPEATIEFGSKTGRLHPLVLAYLRRNPDDLSHGRQRRETGVLVAPSPRGWERLSKLLFIRDNTKAAPNSMIGNACRQDPMHAALREADERSFGAPKTLGLTTWQVQAIASGILGEAVAGRFFLFMEEMDQIVAIDELMAEDIPEKRRMKLPHTELGVFYLAFGLVHLVKDLHTAERALAIVNDFDSIGDKNKLIPIADVKTMTAERIFEKAACELKLFQLAKSPEYDKYTRWRQNVIGGLRLN